MKEKLKEILVLVVQTHNHIIAWPFLASYQMNAEFNNCYYLGLLLSLKASCRFTCNISQNINSLCHLKLSTLITHSIS